MISNYHLVKDAVKVRLLTGAGLIDATVVKVDAANDLAWLKAVGRFAPLPIAASRTVKLGGTVATVGFPDIGLQNFLTTKHTNYTKMKDRFIPCPLSCVWCISWLKSFPMLLAKGEIASLAGAGDDPRYFQISLPVQQINEEGRMKNEETGQQPVRAGWQFCIHPSSFCISPSSLPENVNYAVKSSLLLSFLESVPEVDAKLKDANTKDEAFEDVVKSAQEAAVLVLVY